MPRRRGYDATQRWRNRQERVPTPPAPDARFLVTDEEAREARRQRNLVEESAWVETDEAPEYPVDHETRRIPAPPQDPYGLILIQRTDPEGTVQSISSLQILPSTTTVIARDGTTWRSNGIDRHLIKVSVIPEVPPEPTREVTVDFEGLPAVQARATTRPRGFWKLRNGKFVEISQMDNDHLENCIRMCERNSLARGRRADPMAPGVYNELFNERANRRRRLEESAERARALQAEEEYRRQLRVAEVAEATQQRWLAQGVDIAPPEWRDLPRSRGIPFWAQMVTTDPEPEPQVNDSTPNFTLEEGAPKRRIKS